jgi:hypothetical protein
VRSFGPVCSNAIASAAGRDEIQRIDREWQRVHVADVLAPHVVLSNILFLAADLSAPPLRRSRRWKRVSLRTVIPAQLLGVWSILGAIVLAIVAAHFR